MVKKWVSQKRSYSCGPACVRNMLTAYGLNSPSEEKLTEILKCTKGGTFDSYLTKGLKKLGVEGEYLDIKSFDIFFNRIIKELKSGNLTLIYTNNKDHIVLALESYKNKIRIIDSGYIKRSLKDRWYTKSQLKGLTFCFDRDDLKPYYQMVVTKLINQDPA